MGDPRTNAEHVRANGGICPYCWSANLDWGGFDFEEDKFFQKVVCQDCEKEWSDVYTLTGYAPRR